MRSCWRLRGRRIERGRGSVLQKLNVRDTGDTHIFNEQQILACTVFVPEYVRVCRRLTMLSPSMYVYSNARRQEFDTLLKLSGTHSRRQAHLHVVKVYVHLARGGVNIHFCRSCTCGGRGILRYVALKVFTVASAWFENSSVNSHWHQEARCTTAYHRTTTVVR